MSGIYTTAEYLAQRGSQHEVCEFVVNPIYAVVSSSTSFTIPSIVMVAVYVRIYIEARRQERKIHHLHLSKKLKTSSDATTYTTEQPRGRKTLFPPRWICMSLESGKKAPPQRAALGYIEMALE
ncbi:hypothetical protein X801_03309, partial [Opisthorchis viverrini]